MFFDPGKQRAGIVKTHVNADMFFENVQKWQVTMCVRLLEDVVEITAGLMRVDDGNEMEL
jgi:hypothetical protein